MSPSVIPSPRNELSGLLERSWKGRTATAAILPAVERTVGCLRPITTHHPAATNPQAPSATNARRLMGKTKRRLGTGALSADVSAASGAAIACRNS